MDRVAAAGDDDSDDLDGYAVDVSFAVDQGLAIPDFLLEHLPSSPLPKHPQLARLPRYSVYFAQELDRLVC